MIYHKGVGNAEYFNPRSPCGERPLDTSMEARIAEFQSTLPVWGATAKLHKYFLKFYRI